MPTLYLIRHGETDWNRTGQLQGQCDIPLNDLGQQQALALRPRLSPLGITRVYTSDLQRCRQTLALALPGHEPHLDPRLREIDVGRVAGMTRSEAEFVLPEWSAAWRRDRLRTPFPGGESSADLHQRSAAAISEIVARHSGETLAIVTHGGTMKAIVCAALSLPPAERGHFRVDNTGLTGIFWEGEERTVLFLNDIAHLASVGAPRRLDL